MFFRIENSTGRDKCCICKTATGEMVKHMATGLNFCPTCLKDLKATADMPEEIAPMHQPMTAAEVSQQRLEFKGPHFPPP
jgi:hypothetical protein